MMKSPKAPRWEKTKTFSLPSAGAGLGIAEVDISVAVRRAPARVFRGHVDRVEILFEFARVPAHVLEQEARDPFFDFEHDQLFTQTPLGIAVEDGGNGVEGQDLVDVRRVQVFPG